MMKKGHIIGICMIVFVGVLFLTSEFIRYRNPSLNYDVQSKEKKETDNKKDANVKELRRRTTSAATKVTKPKKTTDGSSSMSSSSTGSSTSYSTRASSSSTQSTENWPEVPTSVRAQHLKEQCAKAKLQAPELDTPLTSKHKIMIFRDNKMLFCKVPKTGTQFFKKVLKGNNRKGWSLQEFKKEKGKFSRFTKMVFVREPFSRLVSGYISKLFTVFQPWFRLGKKTTGLFREEGKSCGHDIKFNEFVKYVIHQLENKGKVNTHFMPNSAQCYPCEIKYDFIGKLETSETDVPKFITLAHLTPDLTSKEFYKNYIERTIDGTFGRAFKGNKCTTVEQAMERAWVAHQMKGTISHKVPFPYDDIAKKKYNNTESLHEMITKLRADTPVTKEEKHFIKKIVLRKAYSMVDKADIEKLRKLYFYDFFLYGYDMNPDFLTDKIPLTLDGWEPFKLKL